MFSAIVFELSCIDTYSVFLLAIPCIVAVVVPFITSISNVVSSICVAFLLFRYTSFNPKSFTCLWIISLCVVTVPSCAVTVIVFIVSPVSGSIIVSSSSPTSSLPPIVTFAKTSSVAIFTFAVSSLAFTVVS